MLLRSSLTLDFELTPPQLIDHDYLILRILYQEHSQDSPDTIFARCERKPNPADFGRNQMHTQTWDSISFSNDVSRIHNLYEGKAIGLLLLENVKVKHAALLLHIIRENGRDYEVGGSNCWWFAEGRFLKSLFIASMP